MLYRLHFVIFLALHLMEFSQGLSLILSKIIQRRPRSTPVLSNTASISSMLMHDFTGTRLNWHCPAYVVAVIRPVRMYPGAMT